MGRARRKKIYITYKGETHSILEWSTKLGINFETLRRRTRLFPDNIEKILSTNLKVGREKGCKSWNKKYPEGTRKEYQAWYDAKNRCTNSNSRNYHRYGGRGLKMSKRWDDFNVFFKDMGKCPPGHSLERKNNNKGYSKDNCKWATKSEQERNKSTNVWVTFNGETLTLRDWSIKLGIHYATLHHRHKRGFPLNYQSWA